MSSPGGKPPLFPVSPGIEDLGDSSASPNPLTPGTVTQETANTNSVNLTDTPASGSTSGPGQRLSSDQLGPNPYTDYVIDTVYETDMGLVQLPIAGPDGTAADVLKVSEAFTRKTVKWSCERLDAKPILPHWDTGNPNECLKRKSVKVCSPAMNGQGKYVYRAEGLYVYYLKVPVDDNSRLFMGAIPPSTDPASIMVIDGSLFDRTILQSV